MNPPTRARSGMGLCEGASGSDTLVPMIDSSRARVLIVFGGRSGEHEVSCATAAGILTAIDRMKWDVLLVGITREGEWVRVADDPSALEFRDGQGQSISAGDSRVVLAPGSGSLLTQIGRASCRERV